MLHPSAAPSSSDAHRSKSSEKAARASKSRLGGRPGRTKARVKSVNAECETRPDASCKPSKERRGEALLACCQAKRWRMHSPSSHLEVLQADAHHARVSGGKRRQPNNHGWGKHAARLRGGGAESHRGWLRRLRRRDSGGHSSRGGRNRRGCDCVRARRSGSCCCFLSRPRAAMTLLLAGGLVLGIRRRGHRNAGEPRGKVILRHKPAPPPVGREGQALLCSELAQLGRGRSDAAEQGELHRVVGGGEARNVALREEAVVVVVVEAEERRGVLGCCRGAAIADEGSQAGRQLHSRKQHLHAAQRMPAHTTLTRTKSTEPESDSSNSTYT